MNFRKKDWNISKDLITLTLTIQVTVQTFQLQTLHFPVTKIFSLLCTVNSSLVSKRVTWAKSYFVICFTINMILSFGQPLSSKGSTFLSKKLPRTFLFLSTLQINCPFHLWEKHWEVHCKINIHCSRQFGANFLYTKVSLWVFIFLGGLIVYPWTFPLIRTPNILLLLISTRQNLVQCKTYGFRNRQKLKQKAEKLLRKCKKVLQSRNQANIILVLVQSCSSNYGPYHYVTPAASSSFACSWNNRRWKYINSK